MIDGEFRQIIGWEWKWWRVWNLILEREIYGVVVDLL